MNLSRGQIKALAGKIEPILKAKVNKRREELRKSYLQKLKLNPQIKEDLTTYYRIGKKYEALDQWSYRHNSVAELVKGKLEEEQNRIVEAQLEKEDFESVSRSEIEAELVLATIDADTLADLLKIMEKKYKIKTTELV